jgi:thiol-disulfide isomerase/thioredoxin
MSGAGEPDLSHLDAEDMALRNRMLRDRARAEVAAEKAAEKASEVAPTIQSKTHTKNNEDVNAEMEAEEDEDDEMFVDEDDDAFEAFRQARLAEMKRKAAEDQANKAKGHGEYREIDETDFLPEVTGSEVVLCHFYHAGFESCKVLDMHLNKIAKKYLSFKVIKLNAEKAPFFVPKLAVRVLPTIVIFHKGVAVDRVVGFAELGGNNEFSTRRLEARLGRSGHVPVDVTEDDVEAEENDHEAGEIKYMRK